MKPTKIAFTLPRLVALKPKPSRYWVWDTKTPGLAVMVTPTGARSYYYVRKVAGRVERVRLGGIEMRSDHLKKAIGKLQGAIADGRSPSQDRQARRAEITFGELWALYLTKHVQPRLRSAHKYSQWYELYLSQWKSRPLRSLQRSEAAALLAKITAAGSPITANRVRAVGSAMLRWARREEGLQVENIFADTGRNAETSKTRYLEPDELRRFWRTLQTKADSTTRDFLTLLLLTGVRKSTLAAARWADLDLRTRTWHIPAANMKAGKPLSLPLARPVIAILAARRQSLPENAEHVFPSHLKEGGHLKGVNPKAWKRTLAAAELTGVTQHDLRRTHATYGLGAGIPIEVLGKALGHTQHGGVTSVYARADLELVRLAVEKTVAALLRVAEAADTEDAARVLAFERPAWAREAVQ
ncbi:MAG: tyrosine-type recombinase/integrase [Thermoanaerobaculales bacterium]